YYFFFFSSRRRHTRSDRDWSSDVCSSDLSHRRPDVVVVSANQEPAQPLKALDQVGWQRVENVWRVGHRGLAPERRRNEAREQHRSEERRVGKEWRAREESERCR